MVGVGFVLAAVSAPRASALEQAVDVQRSALTGRVRFVTALDGSTIPIKLPKGQLSPQPQDFLRTYGYLFGITDPAGQLVKHHVLTDSLQHRHSRWSQVHQGVPVFSGELLIHQNKQGHIYAANGDIYPVPDQLRVHPTIDADTAAEKARRRLNSWAMAAVAGELNSVVVGSSVLGGMTSVYVAGQGVRSVGRPGVRVEDSKLVIVDPGWYGDQPRGVRLAYYVVLAEETRPLREAFFVDAHSGEILDHWTLIQNALDREVYDAQGGSGLPGVLVRAEGDPPTGDPEIDAAYEYGGDFYAYFDRGFSRDSYDAAGATMVSSIGYGGSTCPNAFWNGSQTAFCPGLVTDDILAHEWAHALTQSTADLIYQNQSGQLNEAFSDIFGETIDLFNGNVAFAGPPDLGTPWPAPPANPGIDTPNTIRTPGTCSLQSNGYSDGVRWLIGEDQTAIGAGGAIRDMWEPSCFGDPDRAYSSLQTCNPLDNGGVHSGSGVANHAYAIMVDGKDFNGYSVTGIGPIKAAAVWYRALAFYLTPAANFSDAYAALNQSANDLVGTFPLDPRTGLVSTTAFTVADAAQVDDALLAVELDGQGACGAVGTVCVADAGNCQIAIPGTGQGPTNSLAAASDRNANGGVGYFVAEDFTPSMSGQVSSVCWWGMYYDFQQGSDCATGATTVDDFVIKYFAGDGVLGLPGTLLAEFSENGGSLTIDKIQTGNLLSATEREFEFSATHAPVNVNSGQCYWVEITNGLNGQCVWLWETSPEGNERAIQNNPLFVPAYDPSDLKEYDMAVCVSLDDPLGDTSQCVPQVYNDYCETLIPILDGTTAIDTSAAATTGLAEPSCGFSGDDQVHNDAWYEYVATCDGELRISTCGQVDFDTRVLAYEGCECSAGQTILGCNEDGPTCAMGSSEVSFSVQPNECLTIRIGGASDGATGSGYVTVSCAKSCSGDEDCDDNDVCDGVESCVDGLCEPGERADCDDSNACTTDFCDPLAGCINAPIARENWETPVGGASTRDGRAAVLGPDSPSLLWQGTSPGGFNALQPVTIDDLAIVAQWRLSQSELHVVAHDLITGDIEWSTQMPCDNGSCVGGMTGARDGQAYVATSWGPGSTGFVYALDVANGDILWQSEATVTEDLHSSAVFTSDGDLIVGNFTSLTRIDHVDGSTVWDVPRTCATGDSCSATVSGHKAYIQQFATTGGGIVVAAYDVHTGQLLYESGVLWACSICVNQVTPIFVGPDGTVYWVNGQEGYLHALQDTGNALVQKWRADTAGPRAFFSNGIGPDGTIYSYSRDQEVIRLDPLNGEVIDRSIIIPQQSFSPRMAIDAVGNVFVSDGQCCSGMGVLYAFSADLMLLWSEPIASAGLGGPSLGKGNVMVQAKAGTDLRAYQTSTVDLDCCSQVDCDDGNACTADSCGGAGEGCAYAVVDCCATLDCNDLDPCTMDSCDPLSGCINESLCDDQLFCNGEELCDESQQCLPGEAPCTDPALPRCDEVTDECYAVDIVYVDISANGLNHGRNWQNAYNSLQVALVDASSRVEAAARHIEVWVAAGTYYPDNGTGERGLSFRLISDVHVYGGFEGAGSIAYPGGEQSLDQRDPVMNVTRLSGDIGSVGDPSDNSFHVVDGSGANASAILDGVVVSDGQATGAYPGNIGAGIYNSGGHATYRRCVVRDNLSTGVGSGVYNTGSPRFEYCTFIDNSSHAGIYTQGGSPVVVSCAFYGNVGGGLASGPGTVNVVNTVFSGNDGRGLSNTIGDVSAINCTFSGNIGGGVYKNFSTGSITLANNVLWNNGGTSELNQIQVTGGVLDVNFCTVQGWTGAIGGNGNTGQDPLLKDPDGLDGVQGTADDNLRLTVLSGAVDAGDNVAVPVDESDLDNDGDALERIPIDLDGNSRFNDDPSAPDIGNPDGLNAIVDMGAYEFEGAVAGCAVTADCADTDANNIRDDNCTWWACAGANCDPTELTEFADMGGAFGVCPPDQFANIHDRNHALTCFAGTTTCDSINVDAGGAFGACAPDGFCNIHDANHALSSFAGLSTCTCPAGPMPDLGPEIVGSAGIASVSSSRTIRPGDKVHVRVALHAEQVRLQSYQLQMQATGGSGGQLSLVDVAIEQRDDWVFHGSTDVFQALNISASQMLAGLMDIEGAQIKTASYLATYTYVASEDAIGDFVVEVLTGEAGQSDLVGPWNSKIELVYVEPVVIRVAPRR
jgi:Zn-dependent metalloprotease